MNKRKFLNFLLAIVVILIVVIFSIVYYFIYDHKAETSVYNEIIHVSNDNVEEVLEPEVLNFESSNIQKIYPFTGAFPHLDIVPFLQENLGSAKDLSNEQILRLGWAKVTKQDWADTYVGEGEPVSIKAEVLDKYIKNIFGNIEYHKEDFSNKGYTINPSQEEIAHTYDVKYDEVTDSYICTHLAGDGIGENIIQFPSVTAIKIGDRIKIDAKTVIAVPEETIEKDSITGEEIYYFKYKVYDNYNPETKTLGNELMEYKEINISSEEDLKKVYKDLDLSKLNTISFIYKFNSIQQ